MSYFSLSTPHYAYHPFFFFSSSFSSLKEKNTELSLPLLIYKRAPTPKKKKTYKKKKQFTNQQKQANPRFLQEGPHFTWNRHPNQLIERKLNLIFILLLSISTIVSRGKPRNWDFVK
jgi:prolipoprotein diacylglyceryltransferase